MTLFREETSGNQIGNQNPQQPFDQKEKEAQPANAFEPVFEALIHAVKITIYTGNATYV
ncbi:hypothetical protein GCM10028807_10880 [Spirosoma daeguense]